MRVLITGAGGYLGRRTRALARDRGHEVLSLVRRPAGDDELVADIVDGAAVDRAIRSAHPDAVIHAAAINPGQGDAARMEAVNVTGTRHVARAVAACSAHLVHVSSDMVHSGRAAPYADDAHPTPINPYGRSKAAAEAEALEVVPGAAIVRTSLIYGLDTMDRGTAGFAARLAAGEPLALFTDVLRQPVWVDSLAEALVLLAETRRGGHLNVAGGQVLSREGYGRRMLDWWRVAGRQRVIRGLGAGVSAAIPLDLRLRLDRARDQLGVELPGVDEVLDRVR